MGIFFFMLAAHKAGSFHWCMAAVKVLYLGMTGV